MWQAWELHGQGALCLNPAETVPSWRVMQSGSSVLPQENRMPPVYHTPFLLHFVWTASDWISKCLLQYKDNKMTLRPQSRSGSPWGAFDPGVLIWWHRYLLHTQYSQGYLVWPHNMTWLPVWLRICPVAPPQLGSQMSLWQICDSWLCVEGVFEALTPVFCTCLALTF